MIQEILKIKKIKKKKKIYVAKNIATKLDE